MKKIPKLTDLEIKLMSVLWEHGEGLTIQEIAGYLKEEKISAPSVTQAMQRMVKKQVVRVKEHVLVVSVYSRVFVSAYSREEFLDAELERLNKSLWRGKRLTIPNMLATALMDFLKESGGKGISQENMRDLQQMVNQYMKKEK